MAFPYIFEDDFEEGNLADSGWDSETDTGNKLDFVHYSTLNALSYPAAPYRGAYCARVVQAGTDDAVLREDSVDIAAGVRRYFRFYVWFSPDFVALADNTISLFRGKADAVTEFVAGIRIIASTGIINFGIGEAVETSFSSESVELGVHYCIELDVTVDDGAGNNGTVDLYITKEGEAHSETVSAPQVASLDQLVITHAQLGIINPIATTTGTILFDQFVFDDTRIYPIDNRHANNVVMTKNGHAIAGPGVIEDIQLLPGAATDNVLQIYDTDRADTHDLYSLVAEVRNTTSSIPIQPVLNAPIKIEKGAYCVLTGTNPKAIITVDTPTSKTRWNGVKRGK